VNSETAEPQNLSLGQFTWFSFVGALPILILAFAVDVRSQGAFTSCIAAAAAVGTGSMTVSAARTKRFGPQMTVNPSMRKASDRAQRIQAAIWYPVLIALYVFALFAAIVAASALRS